MRLPISLAWALVLASCAAEAASSPYEDVDPADLETFVPEAGKFDGVTSTFDRQRIVSDEAFFDVAAMDVAAVQRFFEETPYRTRSFLADFRLSTGETAAEALVRVAQEHGFNPLVLLATLQKEKSLVSKTAMPSRDRVDFALGCGCPDGRRCDEAKRGFDRQLTCAAEVIRRALDGLLERGVTQSGHALHAELRTLDRITVVPQNYATVILYTYTPWVLENEGGNWLFWNVWRKYASHLDLDRALDAPFNEGWIGGACDGEEDCPYDGGFCLSGRCSMECTRTCPDRVGGQWAKTFCVEASGGGVCVAQCAPALVSGGCPAGQSCGEQPRFNEPSVLRSGCR